MYLAIFFLRDFSKVPFILIAFALLGVLFKPALAYRSRLLVLASSTCVIAVGMGFRQDALVLMPAVLAGAAFSGMLGALSSLLLLWDQRTADEMRFWVIGALAGRPLDTLDWSLPGLIGGLLVALLVVHPLAALALGERVASGLGHHPQLTRLGTLLAVAILVGTATAAAGPIAFIGLIVPYIARRLVGSDIRRTLGLSMLLGPCVLLLADVISRLLVRPYELPVGVVATELQRGEGVGHQVPPVWAFVNMPLHAASSSVIRARGEWRR